MRVRVRLHVRVRVRVGVHLHAHVQAQVRVRVNLSGGDPFKFKEEIFESPGENLIGHNLSGVKPVRTARPPTKNSGSRLFSSYMRK